MKLDDLLKLANKALADEAKDRRDITECRRVEALNTLTAAAREVIETRTALAAAILSLLTAETCGWERPFVGVRNNAPFIVPPESWSAPVSPADARVMAVMLLRAADESEAGNG